MANEKVSQMVSLTANEVASSDLFMIVDSSARESKKISVNDVLTYLEATGSFQAFFATSANSSISASYVPGSGVNGSVLSSSFATNAYTASLTQRAVNADTASLALTASYIAGISQVSTSSYLVYAGFPNGTSSFALTASNVVQSKTSSFLQYSGINNGTASYSLSSSFATTCITASAILNNALTASNAISSSFANSSISTSFAPNGVVGYTQLTYYTPMVGTGGKASSPFLIPGLVAKVAPKSVNSNFLIMLNVDIGNGGAGGSTCVGLWKQTPFTTAALIPTIGSYRDNGVNTFSVTYIDTPSFDAGTPVTYSAQVFNANGSSAWYVNRSQDNTAFGTSSMTVIEFIL